MCWSVPGKIVKIDKKTATVDISGVQKDVVLDLIDNPMLGDYLLIHAGYAIQKVQPEHALFTIDFFKGKAAQ